MILATFLLLAAASVVDTAGLVSKNLSKDYRYTKG